MHIEPRISLTFNGECDAAFTLYQQCLGGTVTFRLTWGDSPMADQAPAEWRDKIVHATLTVGGTALSGARRPRRTNARRVFKFSSISTMPRRPSASSRCSRTAER